MQEIEFNLLTEPWVRVRLPDNTVQEVSLTDALVHAQSTWTWQERCPPRTRPCCGCCWRCCLRSFPA